MGQQARNDTKTRTGQPVRPSAREARPRARAATYTATHTAPAGQGLSDEEMARQVTDQTSHDRLAESFFEEERGGARSDVEAAKFRDAKQPE
ncbi:hypothetical protein Franean1_0645 [Parafrankia sp. EAN1pec]|uniref:hypothetical protein n=1 Tax=Parafrankia sp. (strain EAN1pec) TaxID=298653 RepID=UPI0000541F1B|nr:hypothetical protein Franean1_0645 [Frankia sp. EAN1pec]